MARPKDKTGTGQPPEGTKMPRKTRSALLETRASRLRLSVRPKPYFQKISPGIAIGYRRNVGAGTWSVRAAGGDGSNWLKRIGVADDFEDGNGVSVLTFFQAIDAARKLARVDDQAGDKPATIDEALKAYEADLKARNGLTGNIGRVRRHLSASMAARPVAQLTAKELRNWRNNLVSKAGLAPASANRTARALSAALSLAARDDKRIRKDAWKDGLARLPDAENGRIGAILPDDVVKNLVNAAYDLDPAYGLLVEVSAVTGSRRSQLLRVEVQDLQDGKAPRLLVPTSRKGRRRRVERRPLPISVKLAAKLRAASAGRPDHAPLLVRGDGSSWSEGDGFFHNIVAACGLDESITGYALRHSSIVRAIVNGIPLRIIASSHDTSVEMIEKHYSRFIIGDASDLAYRKVMLDMDAAPASNVVKFGDSAGVGESVVSAKVVHTGP
jgi:integrase